ncbi:TolC family protein [Thalassotalea ganghwensis]
MNRTFKLHLLVVPIVLAIGGCSAPSGVSSASKQLSAPEQWSSNHAQNSAQNTAPEDVLTIDQWLASFKHENLTRLTEIALKNNYNLKAQAAKRDIAKTRVDVADSSDLPALSLSADQARRKSVADNGSAIGNSASVSLNLSYEVDMWGKLSDEQRQAKLNYAAELAAYEQAELDLVANVSKAYFNLVEAKSLLSLYQERANNLSNNLEMIQSSYRLGLSDALDVYLTQNDVSREQARVEQQRQEVLSKARQLELLLGDYPQGIINSEDDLLTITSDISPQLPAQLLTRRPDILASWYQLLALDAGLAVAHKQRFPSLSLTASTSDRSDKLTNLLDGGALAWSLLGSLTTPLFNAGKLASLEEQARLSVVQKEQQYLQLVFQAFADVENALSNATALSKRYEHYKLASDNALSAEKIAFEQYLKGLVTYTTVLESQRRAFDAQSTLIQLQNQLLQNRISLFVALGGSPMTGIADQSLSTLAKTDSRQSK